MRPSVIRFSAALVLVVTAVVLLGAALAGCATGGYAPTAQTPYCVDAQGQVYPPSYCDGGNPLFWYWLGAWSHPYGYGQTIHVTNVHVTRIDSTDRTLRARYGMPATGRVTSSYRYTPSTGSTTRRTTTGGTTVRTRTGTTVRSGGFWSRVGGSSSGFRSTGRSSFGGRR